MVRIVAAITSQARQGLNVLASGAQEVSKALSFVLKSRNNVDAYVSQTVSKAKDWLSNFLSDGSL